MQRWESIFEILLVPLGSFFILNMLQSKNSNGKNRTGDFEITSSPAESSEPVFRISRIGRISAPTNSFFHLSCFLFLPSFASFWISKYISKSLALANAHAQFFLSLSHAHTHSCTHTRTLAQMHTSTLFPPTCCDSIKINTTRSR